MNRRQVLALLGSAGIAGCLGTSPDEPRGTDRTTATTDRTTETDLPEFGVSNPEGCPSFDSDVKRVVCSPDADDPLTFESGSQSGSLPRAEFEFVLTNGTNAQFDVNFYNWSVWKRAQGDWFRVAPRGWPQPLMYLRPGDSHAWHLTVDNTDLDRPIPRAEGTTNVTVIGLGAGTYAFGTDGWFNGQSYENGTGIATRFELTGDRLPLESVGIDWTKRDGDTVVGDDPEGNEDRAAYVVTRVEDPPEEPRRMITEQVIRRTELRNALAHFESGVRQVRLEAGTTTYPAFGVREARYVEYEGQTYKIETERLEEESN